MTDEKFFERLRADAAPLRYEIDSIAAGRIAARIRDRIRRPTVADLLVAWLRPVVIGLAAVAAAAVIALTVSGRSTEADNFGNQVIEISMAGGTIHVGD